MSNFIKIDSEYAFINIICETIKEQAYENIKYKDSFTFVLSGGRTPKSIFTELIRSYKDSIDWSKVHFFWLDERYIDMQDDDSNYKSAYDNLISKLNTVGSTHKINCDLEIRNTVIEYENELLQFFGDNEIKFDFILLGMGEDGHVASLFPKSKEVALEDKLVLRTEEKYGGYYRITLGLELINKSRYKLLMVKGKEKMNTFKQESLNLPIHKIKNIQKVIYSES